MKRVLVTSCGQRDGCENYRILQPYSNLTSDKIEFVFQKENVLTDDVFNYDAVVLQRPSSASLPPAIKKIKERGIKVIIETDDALEKVPLSNAASNVYRGKTVANYLECLSLADHIHTSTPELHPNGVVFHNAVDLKKYTLKKERKNKTVMWAGSSTHTDTLLIIKPVVEELLRQDVDVLIMGERNWIRSIFPSDKLRTVDWVNFDCYYLMPAMADVFLTPLPDNSFNKCKSELKVIEAAAWGIPSVSSPVAPYLRFNKISGGGNIIVKEKFSSWIDNILSLLEDDKLWKEKSELSYDAVKNFYNLELINEKRKQWWHTTLCV